MVNLERWLLSVLVCGAVSAGCSTVAPIPSQEDNTKDAPDASLMTAPIPSSFMFQLTRPLEVHVAVVGGGGVGERVALQIRRPDQVVLFRGSVVAGGNLTVRFPVTQELAAMDFITTDSTGTQHTQTVAIDPTASALDVQLGGG
jgi:hypothetical protein